jgi:hypothetical protein
MLVIRLVVPRLAIVSALLALIFPAWGALASEATPASQDWSCSLQLRPGTPLEWSECVGQWGRITCQTVKVSPVLRTACDGEAFGVQASVVCVRTDTVQGRAATPSCTTEGELDGSSATAFGAALEYSMAEWDRRHLDSATCFALAMRGQRSDGC